MFQVIGIPACRGGVLVSLIRAFHGAGDLIRIHDHPTFGVARGAANGLHKRGFRAQKALFICVENSNQPHFGNIKTLAQKVDADQHIKRPKAQIAQDFDTLDRIDIASAYSAP